MARLRQAELTRGSIHLVTWLPAEICKRGATLEDHDGVRWTVKTAYTVELERDDIPHGWKVGGLG